MIDSIFIVSFIFIKHFNFFKKICFALFFLNQIYFFYFISEQINIVFIFKLRMLCGGH